MRPFWFRRLLHLTRRRRPRVVSFEDAARQFFRLGKEAARNEQPAPIYQECCERHNARLVRDAKRTGTLICYYCQAEGGERHTDAARIVVDPYRQPGRIMQSYRKAGVPEWETREEPAIHLPKTGR